MDDAPPQLKLSALTWSGLPTTFAMGYGTEYVGTYNKAVAVQLNKSGHNAEHDTVEYIPAAPTSFEYTRHAFPDTVDSEVVEYGALLANNMSPLFRLKRPCKGPPFKFFDEDWDRGVNGLHPDELKHGSLEFTAPDLPVQGQVNVEPGSEDDESDESSGWQGEWAALLLERSDRKESLGEPRTEIAWMEGRESLQSSSTKMWGVELRLEALRVSEVDEFEDESDPNPSRRAISNYTVRATVLRIFVKSAELTVLAEQPEVSGSEDAVEDEYEQFRDGDIYLDENGEWVVSRGEGRLRVTNVNELDATSRQAAYMRSYAQR
ncbi:hypothetical protein FB45DRAFT_1053233 [Roridomyces roridus]|uniref:Uncharacterized protein n=1 Tax=Roridomyces roridus TaxID=1738132 RepID=A0AAD7CBL1_9AGAR|nr:hypothetical protein FB45DRAFT_1053233 [Roridomyces roridus]